MSGKAKDPDHEVCAKYADDIEVIGAPHQAVDAVPAVVPAAVVPEAQVGGPSYDSGMQEG